MGGRSGSFRAKKSGGGPNKKENVEKATNGAGLDNMTYYNAHTATYDRWKARKDREFEERFVSSYGYNPIKEFGKHPMTPKQMHERFKKEQMQDPIGRRYYQLKSQHPEWKNMLQGKTWIRKHTEYGREAEKLRKQGLAKFQIIDRLKHLE